MINFHLVDGIQHPSVEHAYVSRYYEDKKQFSVIGKYKDFTYSNASEKYTKSPFKELLLSTNDIYYLIIIILVPSKMK